MRHPGRKARAWLEGHRPELAAHALDLRPADQVPWLALARRVRREERMGRGNGGASSGLDQLIRWGADDFHALVARMCG